MALASQAALARHYKVTPRTISRWRAHERWPFGTGPYNPDEVTEWLRRHLPGGAARLGLLPEHLASGQNGNGSSELSDREQLSAKKLRLQTERLQQDLDLKGGKYVRREVHDAAIVGLLTMFVRALEGWERSFPGLLEHAERARIEQLLRREFERWRLDLLAEGQVKLATADEVAVTKAEEEYSG